MRTGEHVALFCHHCREWFEVAIAERPPYTFGVEVIGGFISRTACSDECEAGIRAAYARNLDEARRLDRDRKTHS